MIEYYFATACTSAQRDAIHSAFDDGATAITPAAVEALCSAHDEVDAVVEALAAVGKRVPNGPWHTKWTLDHFGPDYLRSGEKTPCCRAMALKSYHRETLNDNWCEERAAPLNGVLPRDGVKEYKTTTGTDFNGTQPNVSRQKLRMINDGNVDEAIRQTAALDWSRGFRSVLPVPDPEPARNMISTQHRVHVNHFASSYQPSNTSTAGAMIAAGGPGGRAVERGKAASGAMGEVYKKSSEPQKDTLAQRSWMYSTDPMITAMQKRAALEASQSKTPPVHQQTNEKNHGRQITAITSIRRNHKGVYVDDEPEDMEHHRQAWLQRFSSDKA